MAFMLVIAETSVSASTEERTRLSSILERSVKIVRSVEAGEVVAENCYLLDMQTGATAFANILRILQDAGLKYKTTPLRDRPVFASQE